MVGKTYQCKRCKNKNVLIECACGCGEIISVLGAQSKIRRFASGHQNRGSNCGNWKGGRYKNPRGYIQIYKPDHPFADSHEYVMEHRLVYEESRNCCLLRAANIHHHDGNPSNNVWYNLSTYWNDQHCRLENTGRIRSEEFKQKLRKFRTGRKKNKQAD